MAVLARPLVTRFRTASFLAVVNVSLFTTADRVDGMRLDIARIAFGTAPFHIRLLLSYTTPAPHLHKVFTDLRYIEAKSGQGHDPYGEANKEQ